MLRTELYFGMSRRDGSEISEDEWQAFVRDEITPRFPDGLTVLSARGQWRDASGSVHRESSRVLVLIHQRGAEADSNIERIRKIYCERFAQDSVMRIDSPVRASF
jgi:hypothetical protein